MKLVVATNNTHKLDEIKNLLPMQYELLSLSDIGFEDEIEENFPDFKGNALVKAQTIYDFSGNDCFADDSGLEVDALMGAPGVFSARYAGEQGNHEANNIKLLKELDGVENRSARFRTVIALIIKGVPYYFEGRVDGKIALHLQGREGFGYDPLFIPEGYNISFAEMSQQQKNKLSHRGRAIRKMVAFLNDLSKDIQPGVEYC